MAIVAIDFGSTHCKAGLFAPDGTALKIASRPTPTHRAPAGWAYLDPGEIQGVFSEVLREVVAGFDGKLSGVGIASMAETGVLVDRRSGATVSPLLPWFEPASQAYAARVAGLTDAFHAYQKFGIQINFKSPLSKILWWREAHAADLNHLVWLSAADYLAAWLTGQFHTDYSLAGRTGCFRVDRKAWDEEWLQVWDLPVALFPPAVASGSVVGETVRADCGLPLGIPVAICGHDHLCAAAGMGAVAPGVVFDSMGTAEVMIGALPERPLTRQDYENGLLYGCHVVPGMGYWMGSLSASGGSVEWLRGLLGVQSLNYAALQGLVESADPGPTGILYFPYLLGSGAPHADPNARAALVGLEARHRAPDLAKAVLEGAAYEMEIIRRAGERMLG
ncbi:MAG TPA: FGGY family carbohydrate kinase, partial [Anaerolineaceae bacterium]|nr:FGGY family carbohydrate kinase [Anaerolineaceae bacterium]